VPRPTTRVLALLELLQTHALLGGAELARRLEVDRRTVRRYVAALEELGIPITAERGRDGGYRLVAGFKLPPMMFTDGEALALSVGLLAARRLGLADGASAAESARAKLERVMPARLKRRVRAVEETVTLDLSRAPAPSDDAALATLSSAAQSQMRVAIVYRSGRSPQTERELDPYGLVYRGGRWYVAGWCHLRRAVRTFRLDRIASVSPRDVGFAKPEGFDALAHLVESVATMPRAFAAEVLLSTDLGAARREISTALGLLEPVEGGVLLRSTVEDLGWLARELSRLPFDMEVRSPPALRDALEECARRLRANARRGERKE